MNEKKVDPLVARLLELGIKKRAIARHIYPSDPDSKRFNVICWSKGLYQPNEKHRQKLMELLSQVEEEKEKLEAKQVR